MGGIHSLGLGRRPVRCRVVIPYRLDPGVLAPLLPTGLRPRLVSGCGVGLLGYTRLGTLRSRWLPNDDSTSDHLAWRILVLDEGEPVSWVARRSTTSRLASGLGERILRDQGRARFDFDEHAFGLRLAVTGAQGPELELSVEAGEVPAGALFGDAASLLALLGSCGPSRPRDVLAPEADALAPRATFAPEPLAIFDLRCAFFGDESLFPAGTAVADGAWRLAERRTARTPGRSTAKLRPLIDTESSPALS